MTDALDVDRAEVARLTEQKYQEAERLAERKVREIVRDELIGSGALSITQVGEIAVIALRGIKEVRIVDRPTETGSPSGDDRVADHHVPISESFQEGGGSQPGPDGGHSDTVRDGGVHSGSGSAEHQRIDRGAFGSDVNVEGKGSSVPVTMDVYDVAALVSKLDRHSFGYGDRSVAAARMVRTFNDWLTMAYGPDWREALWPRKSR